MDYEITIYGDEVLRKKAEPITEITQEIKDLAADMIRIMYEAKGVGLAAEQIGRTEAICVIDIPEDCQDPEDYEKNKTIEMPMVLINPVVSEPLGTSRGKEGCLSLPDLYMDVTRAKSVAVEYTDLNGERKKVRAYGFLARAVQHETDHLNGVLFCDHFSPAQKLLVANKLKRMRKQQSFRKVKQP